jgi:hypothetical protein
MSDVYLAKGLPLQGWMAAGQPARLIKSLELANRRYANTHKEPMFPSPQTSLEREERLATVWQAFIIDSCFSINSYWAQSMDLDDMHCHLPTSAEEFRNNVSLRFAVCVDEELMGIEGRHGSEPSIAEGS